MFDFVKLCLNLFDFVWLTQLCTNFVLVSKITPQMPKNAGKLNLVGQPVTFVEWGKIPQTREAVKKNLKLGLLAKPNLSTPPPLNLGPIIRWKNTILKWSQCYMQKHFLPIMTHFCSQLDQEKKQAESLDSVHVLDNFRAMDGEGDLYIHILLLFYFMF